jgi:hypothetical protein
MRSTTLKSILKTAMFAVAGLILTASASFAQQQINLTAGPTTATLPDGTAVPMWGYSCGTVVTGSTATCVPLNKAAIGNPAIWSPIVITVPTGQGLQINLTNLLSFPLTTPTTYVPTSIMIVGQLGGGLGGVPGSGLPGAPGTTPSPVHGSQVVTWSTVGTSTAFTPPPQPDRVQSFGTEVAAAGSTVAANQVASGSALTWAAATLRPGTFLLESGTHPSIQGTMGLYGMLVVTTAPAGTTAGTAYPAVVATATSPAFPAVTYNAEVPLLMSEIDPVQNNAVNTAVNTAGFLETNVWSGQPGGCGNPSSPVGVLNTCYPPAVNYTPLYYMFNGVAFNRANASASVFPALIGTATAPVTGTVLVRFVNAGSRMHVPSIVGSLTTGASGATTAPTVTGFALMAEDGNPLPGKPRVQSDVFMAAGKTYDVMFNVPAAVACTPVPPATTCSTPALPVYDRELSLSGNAIDRDAGMLAYIGINTATAPPAAPALAPAVARADTYNALVPGVTLVISDPSKGVIANDTNVYGVKLATPPPGGTVTLNANGTFTYIPNAGTTSDHFTYCANGTVTAVTFACSSGLTATVTLGAEAAEAAGGIHVHDRAYTSKMATYLAIKNPGVLSNVYDTLSNPLNDTDTAGLPLTVALSTGNAPVPSAGLTLVPDANGGFTASVAAPGTYTFTYKAQNSQGTVSSAATVTLTFPAPSGLVVNVLDGMDKTTLITDYRWIIEEDKSFYINPACQTNPPPAGCPVIAGGIVPTLGVNFHTSSMPYVAQGCTGPLSCEGGQTVFDPVSGLHVNAVCDVGDGACRPDTTGNGYIQVDPRQVVLDPTKRYYISVLPGDSATPFGNGGYSGPPTACTTAATSTSSGSLTCGHGMGGAPIPALPVGVTAYTAPVTILSQPSPYPTGKLSVFVFEDDFPLNGEQDGGGGTGPINLNNEPGLGQFQIHLWDAFAQNGDFTGQMGFDMFNQPLSNSLAGTKDPTNGFDACPIVVNPLNNGNGATDPTATGITGFIVTCPTFESDGTTPSPLAGQAVIANLMPGRWGVIATPGADRIARGEEWLQTNTLDGQKAHDVFTRISEPSYFQEFGPASYHVTIGFANPAIINSRKASVCAGTDPTVTGKNCTNSITGRVVGERLSRTPDERLYASGSHDAFYWTQCFASFGDPDGEDFEFAKCDDKGNFTLTGLPDGDWRVTTFDQWNDQLVDGLSTPVRLSGGKNFNIGDIAATQWQTNLYTKTFIDDAHTGVATATSAGIPFSNVAVRLRDGSIENLLISDFTGTANFNETFPLFAWYTVETDVTRYKNTGTHVVYDAGGPADGSPSCGVTGYPPCGSSVIGHFLANTVEQVSVPTNLRVPGAVYCKDADCGTHATGILGGSGSSDGPSSCTTSTTGVTTCSTTLSTGRIDPPWVGVEGWQGFPGQNSFIEFGKEPYVANENGGIKGHVVYASTRPFDDPQMLVQTQWEPLVAHVTINLYQEGTAADGITQTLKLVDTTQTSSFDDFAQGFRPGTTIPNMNCPGQGNATAGTAIPDLFFFSLFNQPDYLNYYNSIHGGPALTPLPNNSQFKCYDGMHNWNQVQPVPYDGMYKFPSVTATDANGKPTLTGTNCTICTANTAVPTTDLYYGIPQLPTGKYVVEVVLPPGFELVKEEDKNILIGDDFIAPVTQQFGGLGNVFILPDQAQVASAYNANNAQNPTNSFGTSPTNNIVPGFVPEPTWPCVGQSRIVPDYISLYPQTHQVAPFAGATRNLCDRKEVTLGDQMGAIAKFYIYTSTHIASKFTGGITDDYTSEFDPFSPQFGEKFAPPNLPISIKDWAGNETNRVYSDHWGSYDGMTYSTWEVNPPNPTGYAPTVMVVCMNDPGPIPGPNGTLITDPAFDPQYSQFCYELPFMPGTTEYLDTPVVPTSAFAGAGYNNVDCSYPTFTPAVKEVDGDQIGPWVSAAGKNITITSLGLVNVPNYAYSGPSATTAPYNQKIIQRDYGFGGTNAANAVTIGGITAPIVSWSNTQIVATVPTGVANCAIQQQAQYGGSTAQCGELVITRGDHARQSVDAVTVIIGGKAPAFHVAASGSIQDAIDAAAPGDLIIVDPTCLTAGVAVTCSSGAINGTTPTQTASQSAHSELLIMWKPVRLQGVGAASSIINANTHPAGKLSVWRERINCLFGLSLNGTPTSSSNPFDSTGAVSCGSTNGTAWNFFTPYGTTGDFNPQVDRLPLEAVIGWDAELNGNLAQQLQEPSLMGALEGAGITVLAKGANFPSDPYLTSLLAGFPTGTTLLTANDCASNPNPFPSNFWCNPASIDGLGITNSSQGGGGIFVHGWGHNLQIANNRINSNAGTLSGGINVGQGEFPPVYLVGSTTNAAPGSCYTPALFPGNSLTTNSALPYCQNMNVNVHNNDISLNSSTGDELFSASPAGAGGVSFCTGADNYKFNYNWLCGNLSTGDGGGLGHMGFSYNGDIEHNSILFNQSLNPTIPTNGGGVIIMGAPDADLVCSSITINGAAVDQDCAPGAAVGGAASVGPSDGVGPNLTINANLIMGNAAEAGSGGGIGFQAVNGADVISFPNGSTQSQYWNSVNVTNNIIADNIAGWDGAGIALVDSLNVNIINNTIASNTSTATSGMLFTTLGAPLASQGGTNCATPTVTPTTSCPEVGGLVSIQNSVVFQANLNLIPTVTCPPNHYQGATAANGTCKTYSYPYLANDVFWQNSSYYIGVGALSAQFQQNVVTLYNSFTSTPAPPQPTTDATTPNGAGFTITGGTGACTTASYWDIGARGDTGPGNHASGVTFAPVWSMLTNSTENGLGANNLTGTNPNFVSQYCDGSRTPPESGVSGWMVPPGIADATVPNPVFNLTPVATVDEGNNWINLRWGPLSLLNPATSTVAVNNILGNYSLSAGSPAIDHIPNSPANLPVATTPTLSTDFFGNARPDPSNYNRFDVGAVEYAAPANAAIANVTGGPLTFTNVIVGTTSASQTLTLHNTGTGTLTGIAVVVSAQYARPAGAAGGTCGTSLGAAGNCTINVTFGPTTAGPTAGTVTITASAPVTGSPVALNGTTVARSVTATLTPATTANFGTVARCAGPICAAGTIRAFTLTNTGNVPLTGILQGTLTGTNASEFGVIRMNSTCGPAGGGQALGLVSLNPGAVCTIAVRFSPLTAQPVGVKNANVSVTDAAGAQVVAITGTAN